MCRLQNAFFALFMFFITLVYYLTLSLELLEVVFWWMKVLLVSPVFVFKNYLCIVTLTEGQHCFFLFWDF